MAGARYCNDCGSAASAASGATVDRRNSAASLVKIVSVAAVLTFVAFVAGQIIGRRSLPPTDAGVARAGSPRLAMTDISNMSPEERASRLFKRVMRYSEQRKIDSARFFAPMAIQAYLMAGPLDAHARYDIGAISAAVGEAALARLEADSILVAQPKHLLALALAMRAARMQGDSAAAASFRRRLVAAAPSERARGLDEYTEHGRDIDQALAKEAGSP